MVIHRVVIAECKYIHLLFLKKGFDYLSRHMVHIKKSFNIKNCHKADLRQQLGVLTLQLKSIIQLIVNKSVGFCKANLVH